MRRIHKVILLYLALFLQGCFVYGKKDMLSIDSVVKQKEPLSSTLSSVNVSNNQITINGTGFSKVTSVTIKGSGVDQALFINSKSDSQLIAYATNVLALLVGGTFDLIIGTVDAQATYAVTFTLQNGAIQVSHLSSMGATSGQVLKYNGSVWVPTSQIDAQIYMGVWDATTTIPDVTLTSAGDYYIVSVAGAGYAVGDWIISDGYDWTKVAYSKTSVTSFNGRKGNVILTAADYLGLKDGTTHKITGSSLNDFANVDLTGAVNGNFLKFDGANWVPASAVGGGSIGAADIAAGVIDNTHVSATAAIAQSKIADLTTDLTAKQNTSSLATDVKAITLTGLTSNTGSVAATDTIFGAFRKLMNVSGDYVSSSSGASIVTGTIAVSGTGMITVPLASGTTANEVANITYVGNAIAANGVWTKNANGVDIGYTAGKVGVGTTDPTNTLTLASGGTGQALYNTADQTTNYERGIFKWSGSTLFLGTELGGTGQFRTLKIGSAGTAGGSIGRSLDFNGMAPFFKVSNSTSLAGNNFDFSGINLTGSSVSQNIFVINPTINQSGTSSYTALLVNPTETATGSGSKFLADFQVGGVSKVAILNSGNVGIGTTSPNTLLNIGSGTPTTATNGIQFGSDVSANLYRYSPGIIRSDGWIFGVSGFGGAIAQANTLYPLSAQDLVIQTRATGSNNIIFKSVGTTPTETMRMDTNGNIGIGTPAPTSRIHGDTTLSVATGNEVAYELDYTTNKATSGNDTGLKINMTDTLSPGTSYLIDAQVGGVSKFKVDNAGAMTITGQLNTGVLASSSTLVGGYLSVAGANMGTSGTVRVASTNILDEDISYIKISPTYNKPTATSRANTDLLINRTETSLGTTPGTQFLIDAQVAGVSKFNVSNAGNVGIGTSSPSYPLHIYKTGATSSLGIQTTTTAGTSDEAQLELKSGNDYTRLFGRDSDNNFGIFHCIAGACATKLRMDGSGNMRLMEVAGNVGIGTAAPAYKLDVNGTLNVSGATTNVSDLRFKKEIQKIPDALEKISAIDGVTYKLKNEEFPDRDFSHRREMGVIAQTVEKIFPEAVSKDQNGYRSVAYTMLIAPVIEAIKQLSGELKALVARVFSLEEKDKAKDRAIASSNAKTTMLEDKAKKLEADNKAKDKEIENLKVRLNRIEQLLLKK